jgi:hypothetical protein
MICIKGAFGWRDWENNKKLTEDSWFCSGNSNSQKQGVCNPGTYENMKNLYRPASKSNYSLVVHLQGTCCYTYGKMTLTYIHT